MFYLTTHSTHLSLNLGMISNVSVQLLSERIFRSYRSITNNFLHLLDIISNVSVQLVSERKFRSYRSIANNVLHLLDIISNASL